MRTLVFTMLILISACVSNAPSHLQGNGGKADRTVVYKHLDADRNYVLPNGIQCRSGSVFACTVRQGISDCSCHMIKDLENQAARMISRGEGGGVRLGRGFRH